jgi:CPA2 family monovalent cation:H+ antiporter-2
MELYFQIAICFTAVGISAFLAEKLGLFFAPFYILAGIVAGPAVLKLVVNTEVITLLGDIGVVFLMFFLGLEFSLHKFLKQTRTMFISGSIDFIVNFGLGFALGMVLGLSAFYSIILAGAIYMSSSGIITKSLIELQINKKPEGQMIMGIMVFEDLVMLFFLIFVSTGLLSPNSFSIVAMLIQLGKSFAFCGGLLFVAKVLPHWLDKLLTVNKKELLILMFFSLVLITTSVGKLLGVSEALSAFFLGIAFSNTKNVKKIESATVIFRDLFGSVFFFSFGMVLEFGNLSTYLPIILYASLLAVVGKFISSIAITKILKCNKNMSLFIGFITIPRGEFSLLISKMVGDGMPFLGPVMVVVAIFTTFLSSIILKSTKALCKIYNVCIIFPRSRVDPDAGEWGEMD